MISALSQSGSTIGPHDSWIAATALAHDYDLLTTNANEFRRVSNLRVIDYLDASYSIRLNAATVGLTRKDGHGLISDAPRNIQGNQD